jgi:protein-L-isoaspartate O-methyltransferase
MAGRKCSKEELAKSAASILAELGYDNVQVLHGDGTLGWEEHAPYDGIVVTAGGPEVPVSFRLSAHKAGPLKLTAAASSPRAMVPDP